MEISEKARESPITRPPLYRAATLCYKKLMDDAGPKQKTEGREIEEERRKVRFLRHLVDFSILEIQESDLPYEKALELVEGVKRAVSGLFPGKEDTFELIYRPRFMRVIREKYGIESNESPSLRTSPARGAGEE